MGLTPRLKNKPLDFLFYIQVHPHALLEIHAYKAGNDQSDISQINQRVASPKNIWRTVRYLRHLIIDYATTVDALMAKKNIFIARHDPERLRALIDVHGGPETPSLEKPRKELHRAVINEPSKIPGDVVTMNSIVRVKDVKTGEERSFILVSPAKTGAAGKAVSILAPIDIALRVPGRGSACLRVR